MLACHGVTPCLWMGLCHHMVPDRPGRVTELRQRDACSSQGPSGRAADLFPALVYHYSPAPPPVRPHPSLARENTSYLQTPLPWTIISLDDNLIGCPRKTSSYGTPPDGPYMPVGFLAQCSVFSRP